MSDERDKAVTVFDCGEGDHERPTQFADHVWSGQCGEFGGLGDQWHCTRVSGHTGHHEAEDEQGTAVAVWL